MTPTRYRIAVRGRLSERFSSAFEGMTLEPGPHGSVLVGDVLDQSQLYGILERLRDFGIDLVGVEHAGPVMEDDCVLLLAAHQGDSAAFAALAQRHHGTLLRVARCVTLDGDAAADLAARTWRAALSARGSLDGSGSLRRWLVTMLLTVAAQPTETATTSSDSTVDVWRCIGDQRPTVRRSPPPEARWQARPPVGRDMLEARPELSSGVQLALDELPLGPRLVITLRDVEGWTTAEIADELGVPEAAARSLLHEARSKLLEALEPRVSGT
jgi:RNA polymerase sigma-70 factor, ECF subfamily